MKIPRIVLFWTHATHARVFESLYFFPHNPVILSLMLQHCVRTSVSDIYSPYWPFIALVLLMYSYTITYIHTSCRVIARILNETMHEGPYVQHVCNLLIVTEFRPPDGCFFHPSKMTETSFLTPLDGNVQ